MNESLDQKIRLRNAVARAHTQAASGQISKMMVKEAPVYSGRALQLLPIVLVNLVLTLLTAGIYRFWAKTRLRRYFLSRVSFLGDALEYTGTGMELFRGFLIALAALVPFFIVTSILQNFLVSPDAAIGPVAAFQLAYLFAIYFLYHVAVFRAQRYRLSRTTWRGIRGGQQGSAMLYALYAIGLGLLTLVTLGLAYPVMRRVLMGYRINAIRFGSETVRMDGGFAPLMRAWLLPWLLMFLAVLPLAFTLWVDGPEVLTDQSGETQRFQFGKIRFGVLVPIGAAGWLIANFWYRAAELRHFAGGTRFEDLKFESRLGGHHLFLPYLLYGIVIVLTIAGALIAAVTLAAGYSLKATGPAVPSEMETYLGLAIIVVGTILLASFKPVIVQNWIFRNLCRTLTIQGSFSPDRLFQNQFAIPNRGEGLADALDVDAF